MKQLNSRTELKTIQAKLRKAIQQSNLKQKEIAQAVGISEKTISAYMKKDIFPSLDTFGRICTCLGIKADEILGISKNEPTLARIDTRERKDS